MKKEVVFKAYVDCDESMLDIYFGIILGSKIVGLEQKDGSILVFNDTALDKRCSSKEEFEEKYFMEAL